MGGNLILGYSSLVTYIVMYVFMSATMSLHLLPAEPEDPVLVNVVGVSFEVTVSLSSVPFVMMALIWVAGCCAISDDIFLMVRNK